MDDFSLSPSSCSESKPCSSHKWGGFLMLVLGSFVVGSLRNCWTLEGAWPGQESMGDQCPSIHWPLGTPMYRRCLGQHPASAGQESQQIDGWRSYKKIREDISAPAPPLLCSVVVRTRGTTMYRNCMAVYNNCGVKKELLEDVCQILAWSAFYSQAINPESKDL